MTSLWGTSSSSSISSSSSSSSSTTLFFLLLILARRSPAGARASLDDFLRLSEDFRRPSDVFRRSLEDRRCSSDPRRRDSSERRDSDFRRMVERRSTSFPFSLSLSSRCRRASFRRLKQLSFYWENAYASICIFFLPIMSLFSLLYPLSLPFFLFFYPFSSFASQNISGERIQTFSLVDPYHFDMDPDLDPDPRIQIGGMQIRVRYE